MHLSFNCDSNFSNNFSCRIKLQSKQTIFCFCPNAKCGQRFGIATPMTDASFLSIVKNVSIIIKRARITRISSFQNCVNAKRIKFDHPVVKLSHPFLFSLLFGKITAISDKILGLTFVSGASKGEIER